MSTTPTETPSTGAFAWFRTLGAQGRRAFVGAFGGYALDSYDYQVLPLSLAAISAAFALTTGQAGLLATDHPRRLGDRRRAGGRARRPHRPGADAADHDHHLRRLHRGLRLRDQLRDAAGVPRPAGPRLRRRVGGGRGPRRRVLPPRAPGPGARVGAERVGRGLGARRDRLHGRVPASSARSWAGGCCSGPARCPRCSCSTCGGRSRTRPRPRRGARRAPTAARSSRSSAARCCARRCSRRCWPPACRAATTGCSPGCRPTSRPRAASPSSAPAATCSSSSPARSWATSAAATSPTGWAARRRSCCSRCCRRLLIVAYTAIPTGANTAILFLGFPLGFCASAIFSRLRLLPRRAVPGAPARHRAGLHLQLRPRRSARCSRRASGSRRSRWASAAR